MRHIAMLAAVFAVGSFLLPAGARAQTPDDPRAPPAVPFDQARGTLPLPVAGRLVLGFGERTRTGGLSKGIAIVAHQGAPVVSPCDGRVVYAGEFRNYGTLVIISVGGGYHLLLSGMSRIDVKVGRRVRAGEPIGALTGLSADGPPTLHIELLKDRQTIDPTPWWRKS